MFEQSLVQYESPQLIMHNSTKVALEANRKIAEKMTFMNVEDLIANESTEVLDMLDVLMPPRIIEESGKIWFQKVARTPASVSDLLTLKDRLEYELIRQGAREIGLCDKRRKLYDQLFDELIRQEIVVCPERGRLFRMIRRESELSLASLLSCYESSMAYGIKKKLLASRGSEQLTSQVTQLFSKTAELNDIIRDLEPQVADVKKTTEVKEAQKDEEFGAIEKKVLDDNEAQLAMLMESINVRIEVEE